MMIAETNSGQLVQAEAFIANNDAPMICPACKQPVLFKAGKIKVPHFAHRVEKTCSSFSESESVEHLQGKRLLQQWSETGQLEAYLRDLQQRPDLLLSPLALEFQCSPLSLSSLEQRTIKYQQHQYIPWWLVGKQLFQLKRWSKLQKSFCSYQNGLGTHLWHLQTHQQELWLIYQVYQDFQRNYFFKVKKWSFKEQPLAELLMWQPMSSTGIHWDRQSYRRLIRKQLFYKQPAIMQVQSLVYSLGGNLQTLPKWCYAPSAYYFYVGEGLLFLRFCYYISATFSQWLKLLKYTTFRWSFPLASQKTILTRAYQECKTLEQADFLSVLDVVVKKNMIH